MKKILLSLILLANLGLVPVFGDTDVPYDLIVWDGKHAIVHMRVEDGFQMCREIRQRMLATVLAAGAEFYITCTPVTVTEKLAL